MPRTLRICRDEARSCREADVVLATNPPKAHLPGKGASCPLFGEGGCPFEPGRVRGTHASAGGVGVPTRALVCRSTVVPMSRRGLSGSASPSRLSTKLVEQFLGIGSDSVHIRAAGMGAKALVDARGLLAELKRPIGQICVVHPSIIPSAHSSAAPCPSAIPGCGRYSRYIGAASP